MFVYTVMSLSNDRLKCAHLLRRFGLGASESELDEYLASGGIDGAVDRLVNYERTEDTFNLGVADLVVDTKNPQRPQEVPMQLVSAWWITRMLQTQRPLEEKMTVFWHNHFATSAQKVNLPLDMLQQNQLLRQYATGNFRDMLHAVSKDPAMLFWLDNEFNVKGKPNENFAREVMELFTLGIGNYTEKDVQESARAYTGWGARGPNALERDEVTQRYRRFVFRDGLHDGGPKTFMGRQGNFDGDDILDILCDSPKLPEFLAHKFWVFFAYPDPEPEVISRLADRFRGENLELKALITGIISAPEFYSDRAERAIFKTPVDVVIGTARQLGIGGMIPASADPAHPRARFGIAVNAANAMKGMGMQLLYPPDVAGWDQGASWITTATMMARISWADGLFGHRIPGHATLPVRYQVEKLFQTETSPSGVAAKLASVFDVPLSQSKLDIVAEAAQSGLKDSPFGPSQIDGLASATRLIFASPEFQMN